jgi:hypothetical protein
LFYQLPTQPFWGAAVLSASFQVKETHSYSCTTSDVDLYWTKAIHKGLTWGDQDSFGSNGFWLSKIDSANVAYGWRDCPSSYVSFRGSDVKSEVQDAANGKWKMLTLGLKAHDESTRDGWKRFSGDASLVVKYNRHPDKPNLAEMRMFPGGDCSQHNTPDTAITLNSAPQLQTVLRDPDTGDHLNGQFEVWGSINGVWDKRFSQGTGPGSQANGSVFKMNTPSSLPTVNQGAPWLAWRVQAWDNDPDHQEPYKWYSVSPWSDWCYFRYDTSAPSAPTIASADGRYPASDPANPDDPWQDGVGVDGKFTITPKDAGVAKYKVEFTDDPVREVTGEPGKPVIPW